MEYGYSCMGYEIAGGLGAKMAAPERDVYVIVGDGTYLMLSSELVTSVQEGVKLIVLLWDNGGFKSIGSLSRSLGLDGFGTRFIQPEDGVLVGDSAGDTVEPLQIDFAMNARSLGCNVIECATRDDYVAALKAAKEADRTTVVVIKNDRLHSVPGYESWWDVAVPRSARCRRCSRPVRSTNRCERRNGTFWNNQLTLPMAIVTATDIRIDRINAPC